FAPVYLYYLRYLRASICFSFFFHAPSPPEIYTLSLHDALPISGAAAQGTGRDPQRHRARPELQELAPGHADRDAAHLARRPGSRSEEHTSELQSRFDLVCRLLLEKKKKKKKKHIQN